MRSPIRFATAAALLMLAGSGVAAPTAVRLTPEQIEAAKNSGEQRNRAAEALALLPDGDARPDRRIHGEVGAGIGTGGYNNFYGTVVAPLGDSGTAAFSYSQTDYGRNYRRGYYGGGSFGALRR